MSGGGSEPLTRYWIEFGNDGGGPGGVCGVCGVTAATVDEALALAAAALFRGRALPPVTRLIEDVDVAMLDAFHVGPAILPPHTRGVWYPPSGGAR